MLDLKNNRKLIKKLNKIETIWKYENLKRDLLTT